MILFFWRLDAFWGCLIARPFRSAAAPVNMWRLSKTTEMVVCWKS